jgi:hypothetical protein
VLDKTEIVKASIVYPDGYRAWQNAVTPYQDTVVDNRHPLSGLVDPVEHLPAVDIHPAVDHKLVVTQLSGSSRHLRSR